MKNDIYSRIKDANQLMAEGFAELRRIAAELANDRGLGSNDFSLHLEGRVEPAEEMDDLPSMIGMDDSQRLDGYLEESYECSDFPGRPFFDPDTIDPDDPGFASGMSLGIPIAVVVRSNDGQDKLLPIKDGRFVDERKRT